MLLYTPQGKISLNPHYTIFLFFFSNVLIKDLIQSIMSQQQYFTSDSIFGQAYQREEIFDILNSPINFQLIFQQQNSQTKIMGVKSNDDHINTSQNLTNYQKTKPIKKSNQKIKHQKNFITHDLQENHKGLKGYPTNNFLTVFKKGHEQWLRKHVGEYFNTSQVLKQVFNPQKKHGNLNDMSKLYNDESVRQTLSEMFKCKYLYRRLMLSRVGIVRKKIFIQKIKLFKLAFEKRCFSSIN